MTKIAIIDDEIQILQSIQRYLGRRKQFDIKMSISRCELTYAHF